MSVERDSGWNRTIQRRKWLGYAATVVLEIALTALLILISRRFPLSGFPIPYVLLTMLIAYFFGEGPAAVAVVLGWLIFTYFFVPPPGIGWPLADSLEDWARHVAFILGVSVVAIATTQARKSNRRIRRLADEALALNEDLRNEIAERERAEVSLRESEAQLRTVFDNLTEGVVVSDLNGNLLHWNFAAVHMHGFETEEEGRRQLAELMDLFELASLDGRVLPLDEWPLSRILKGERLRNLEIRIRRINSDWERVFSYGGSLVSVAEDSPLLAVVTVSDITERKQAEQEVRKLNAELEQRVALRTVELEDAVKELESFSYSVSHDLRAPLRAIDGFSNALLERYLDGLDPTAQDYLRRVRAAAQRMGQLIDDILGLSRAGRAEMHRQRVDLGALATDILAELRNSQQDREVETSVAPNLIVNADAHLLRIVIDNLLSNAWKFTSKRDVARIEVGVVELNGERVYYVRDNGAGFDPRYADKLFSPFQRLHTESDFPGTGIGLALIQRILRRHGGRIWAEGAVDQGATFYFTVGEETAHGRL